MKRWVMTLCVRADQATRALERIADAAERIADALEKTPHVNWIQDERLAPGVQDPRD